MTDLCNDLGPGPFPERFEVYPLDVSDIWHAVGSIRNFELERRAVIAAQWAELRLSQPELADDIMDDISYYGVLEIVELWSFCIWRIHGLLEAMVDAKLPEKDRKLRGLSKKLDLLCSRGAEINPEHIRSLTEWTALRNELTHLPPKTFHSPWLDGAYVERFAKLATKILEQIGYQQSTTPC